MKRKTMIATSWLVVAGTLGLSLMAMNHHWSADRNAKVAAARQRLKTAVAACDQANESAVHDTARSLAQWFESRKPAARPLSADLISLGGKWQWATSNHQEYEAWIRQQFASRIFSDRQLLEAVQSQVAQCAAKVAANENRLLLTLRADLADPAVAGALPEMVALRTQVEQRLVGLMQQVSGQVGTAVGGDVLSLVVQEVTWSIMTRIGIGSAMTAAGIGSSWATFGASVVLGIAIDMVVDKVMDAEGQINMQICMSIDDIHGKTLEAYKREMLNWVVQRGTVRSKALDATVASR
jgi:hypothetical protein